jgi:hypothetical protein
MRQHRTARQLVGHFGVLAKHASEDQFLDYVQGALAEIATYGKADFRMVQNTIRTTWETCEWRKPAVLKTKRKVAWKKEPLMLARLLKLSEQHPFNWAGDNVIAREMRLSPTQIRGARERYAKPPTVASPMQLQKAA